MKWPIMPYCNILIAIRMSSEFIINENDSNPNTNIDSKKQNMFAASRNIGVSMTSSMVTQKRQSARRRSRSRTGSSSPRSGNTTPKARNPTSSSRSSSPIDFDRIWSDLVAASAIYPSEGESQHFQQEEEQDECQVGRSLYEEGRAKASAGEYDQAVELLTKALDVQKSEFGEESLCVAHTLIERGNASAAAGLLYDSVLDLEKALLIERRLFRDERGSLEIADSYLRCGTIQHQRGNFVEAIHCFECALEIRKRVLGESNTRVLRVICVLAAAYHRRSQYNEALDYYIQALAATKTMSSDDQIHVRLWLRRCLADKNLYYSKFEDYWDDPNCV